MQMKNCPFEATRTRETLNTQLSTNPWFPASQIHSTPEVRENEKCQQELRNESQASKARKNLETLDQFQQAN
jgi:hypothetical protein